MTCIVETGYLFQWLRLLSIYYLKIYVFSPVRKPTCMALSGVWRVRVWPGTGLARRTRSTTNTEEHRMVQVIMAPNTPLMWVGMDRFRWTNLDVHTQTQIKEREAWKYKQKTTFCRKQYTVHTKKQIKHRKRLVCYAFWINSATFILEQNHLGKETKASWTMRYNCITVNRLISQIK